MNYLDLSRAKAWMEARWSSVSKAWGNWENPEFFADFEPFTAGALEETLRLYYRAGNERAPSPSVLLRLLGEVQRRRIEAGDDPLIRDCRGRHVWSAPWPHETDRRLVCALCLTPGDVFACEHLWRDGHCVYCPDTDQDGSRKVGEAVTQTLADLASRSKPGAVF